MSKVVLLVCLFCLFLTGCATHRHIIGRGAQTGVTRSERQWYAIYGLAPINEVDTAQMAGDTQDYEIETSYSLTDILVGGLLGWVTITSRTVKVTK